MLVVGKITGELKSRPEFKNVSLHKQNPLFSSDYYKKKDMKPKEKPLTRSMLTELATKLESPREKKPFVQTRAHRSLERNVESRMADEQPRDVPVYRDLGGDKGVRVFFRLKTMHR